MIAGDGILYQELIEMSDPYIILTGQVDFEHIVKILDASDIFCLPSDGKVFAPLELPGLASYYIQVANIYLFFGMEGQCITCWNTVKPVWTSFVSR